MPIDAGAVLAEVILAPASQREGRVAWMGRGLGVKGAQRSSYAMGKGAQANGGVKGAQRSGHAIGKGAQLNDQIIRAAEDKDKAQFLSLLHQLSNDRVKLDIVNVVTILHRGAKMRLSLPTQVVRFLGATLNEAHCPVKFKPRGFVWL